MEVTHSIEQVRICVKNAVSQGKLIGFVPTMGALHEGHISLIKAAKQKCDFVVVSIFVNPTQFGPGEDFDKYPRPIEKDTQICEQAGVDMVFNPTANEMYKTANITWVNVEKLTEHLCGRSRPVHFRGVATVCTKLFNIVRPDFAFFGQKDAQQAIVIKRMVADLNMPLEIVICPIIRENDGLAMSSRNKYLSVEQRSQAVLLHKSLMLAEKTVKQGLRNCAEIKKQMREILNESSLISVEYINIVNIETLADIEEIVDSALIALAVNLGTTRLIDNIIVDVR
ncbi:MAG TPA: pantoate--beta-alanine ligase [Sedimentisphaerales bacterium]|nr:pantoate--beta-alanine ligase [Sedimentisphaerales bacterium]